MIRQNRETYNTYMRKYIQERCWRRRAQAIEQLGGKCVVCGSTDDLEFDHIDASTVDRRIRGSLWTVSEERLQAELAKCQLLCHKHHREKTIRNKETGGGSNKIPEDSYQHGSARMYFYKKCRCDWCVKAKHLYSRKVIKIDEICERDLLAPLTQWQSNRLLTDKVWVQVPGGAHRKTCRAGFSSWSSLRLARRLYRMG
jgi:hypothetical protein